jgi:hypothetical protein
MLAVILVHFNNAWNAPIGILNKASAIGARCPQLCFHHQRISDMVFLFQTESTVGRILQEAYYPDSSSFSM